MRVLFGPCVHSIVGRRELSRKDNLALWKAAIETKGVTTESLAKNAGTAAVLDQGSFIAKGKNRSRTGAAGEVSSNKRFEPKSFKFFFQGSPSAHPTTSLAESCCEKEFSRVRFSRGVAQP